MTTRLEKRRHDEHLLGFVFSHAAKLVVDDSDSMATAWPVGSILVPVRTLATWIDAGWIVPIVDAEARYVAALTPSGCKVAGGRWR